ncbi:hypothetical protein DVH24_011120 [Malus domestica]|uniref:Uncharacterized protein n=1 Tax=Malus domestica TaxID=3750 RepID=A0A498JUD4_MALDO|nr:hypothetical protein DVH24_011120 [Malus domestica]
MLIRQCVYNNVKREEIQKMFPVSFSENDGEMHSRISTQCQVLRSTDQLTAVVDVGEGDAMLEVGLGTGSLTNVLINAGAFVLAIKKDPYMATHVSERFAETDRLKNMNCQGSTLEKVIWVEVLPVPKPPTKWKLLPKQKEKRSSYSPTEKCVRCGGCYKIEKCWLKLGVQVCLQQTIIIVISLAFEDTLYA